MYFVRMHPTGFSLKLPKRKWFLTVFLLLGLRAAAQIIPAPAEQVQAGGYFVLDKQTELFSPVKTGDSVLRRFYQTLTGLSLVSAKNRGEKGIVLQIDSQLLKAKEAYRLDISAKQILIRGHDEAGLFYGFMSMLQQISEGEKGSLRIRCGSVNDQPRFAYRGMMLDVCRRFFPTETLKHWLDVLAFYKINTFHWHLTDDQGWRIEIKKYPELQSKSAWRNETLIGHKKELPHRFDGKKYGGYYTQEQVKELVKYAADRHITVIPEIEMPGHAQAALAAYPQLGCTGGPYQTATFWGIFDDVYCAGNEETFRFLEGVLDEVIPLFPSKYIHIGGDECPKTRWKACPKCQKRIADEHLKDEHELQTYFIGRMEKYVNGKGRSIIGWDEILEGGLTPNSTIMSWRGESGGIAAAKQHHDVIMTPDNYVYLDYYQSLSPDEPVAAGGYLPLSKIYNWEPLPDSLSAEEKTYIKGVQTNAWSEYFVDKKQADYMLFPRVLALSETAWSAHGRKEYTGFLARVRAHQKKLARFGVQGFPYFDEITDEPRCDTQGLSVALSTTLPGAEIRYTLNESAPGKNSLRYTGKLPVKRVLTIKAQPFLNGRAQQRVYVRSFDPSATTGKKIILKTAPQGAHAHPAITLVNGIEGTNRYNDGQWLGFSGADLDATVDLGAEKMISEIGISILHYPWQKMWAPVKLSFAFSTDGRHFETVYTQDKFSVNGINRIRQKITARKVRYIRVHGVNKGLIPSGAYGAGGKAWLLADEIYAN